MTDRQQPAAQQSPTSCSPPPPLPAKVSSTSEENAFDSAMKGLRGSASSKGNTNTTGSESGCSSMSGDGGGGGSGGGSLLNGGGNNSDNSALVSLGNTSFGFNFDSGEDGKSSSEEQNESGSASSDSDNNNNNDNGSSGSAKKPAKVRSSSPTTTATTSGSSSTTGGSSAAEPSSSDDKPKPKPKASSSSSPSHNESAETASANLKSIATSCLTRKAVEEKERRENAADGKANANTATNRKRKATATASTDNDSGGYNSDDDGCCDDNEKGTSTLGDDDNNKDTSSVSPAAVAVGSGSGKPAAAAAGGRKGNKGGPGGPSKKKKLNESKREERNAREKERSYRISKQIDDLRDALSSGGVVVPKGTKSSVLTEAANYIRVLQQHQYRSEIDRHQLIQQMQIIGSGAQGPQASAAIRHVAAQNGVWSLGNFGGSPPKSAMSFYQPAAVASSPTAADTPDQTNSAQQDANGFQPTKVDSPDYRFVFNSCGVGMAIASMGGAFIDCNQLFSQLAGYPKQELCSLTIFNLTSRTDLQQAFEQISQMISPPMDAGNEPMKPVVLRGAMKDRTDLGLSIALVKGEDGIAKNFCVTLVKNPASPFDEAPLVPASFESVLPAAVAGTGGIAQPKDPNSISNAAPAFTSG